MRQCVHPVHRFRSKRAGAHGCTGTILFVRFAGMVLPGDIVTFTADRAGEGKLDLSAVNERGEAVLTKAAAEYKA